MAVLTRATVGAEVRQAEEQAAVVGQVVAQNPGQNRRRLDALVADARQKMPPTQKVSVQELELGALPTIETEIRSEHERTYRDAQRAMQQARADVVRYEWERKLPPLEAPPPPTEDLTGFGDLLTEIKGLRFEGKLDRLERQYAGASLADLWAALEQADATDPVAAAWLERRLSQAVTATPTGATAQELTRNKIDQKRIGALLEARQGARLTEADRHALAEWRVRLDTAEGILSRAALLLSAMRTSPSMSIAKIATRHEAV